MTTTVAERDLDLVNRLRTLYELARSAKRSKYDTWLRNYKLVNNRLGMTSSYNWAPQPKDSEIYPTLSSIAAWMTDQHTSVDVTAAADPYSPFSDFMQKVADDLSVVLSTNWLVESYERQVKMVVWDAFQTGAGIFKNVWDQSLAGGLGNVALKRVDPWAFYPDPNATSLDDMEFCVETRRMSVEEIERRWPDSGVAIEAITTSLGDATDSKPDQWTNEQSNAPKANPGALPQGNGRWAAKTSRPGEYITNPGVVVYEFWLKENDVYYEKRDSKGLTLAPSEEPPKDDEDLKQVAIRWRVVVVAANEILMDEYADELCRHGSHPYERYVFEENGEFYGIALVDHLAHPQIYLNRLLTALQQNAELVGNPVFLESTQSGLDRVNIINKPGQRLRLQGTAGMQNKPEWMIPPEMPSFIRELVEFWIGRIENISGLSAAIKGGQVATSRTPEGVISTIQEAAFVRIRSALSNLEDTLRHCAEKQADLIIDNYTEPRIVAIVGPQGQHTAMALSARHFMVPTKEGAAPLKYSLLVQAGASQPTSRQARVAEADQAYALGIIDRQAWFQAHQYPQWQDILRRVNEQIADGSFQPPGARQRQR